MRIKDMIDNYIKGQKEDKYHIPVIGVFHASECGKCPRFIYLDKTDSAKPKPLTQRSFLVGRMFHDFIEKNILKDYKLEQQIQGKIGDITIVGRVDALNDKEIIELKTTSGMGYITKPSKEYIIQLNIYMHFTGIHEGRIVYINKNNMNTLEFLVKYNKELFEHTINKLRFIHQKLKEKVNPMVIDPEITPYCYNCRYRSLCFKNQY